MTSNGFIPCFSHWKRNCPVPVISPIAPVACRGRNVASIFSWNRVRPAATQAVALESFESAHTPSRPDLEQRSGSGSINKGVARSGGGNHRGSIFRLIVGTALIERDAIDCDSWDDRRGSAPPEVREREQPLERAVSQVIGNMPFFGFPSRMSRVRKACADSSNETLSRFSATTASRPSIRPPTHGSAAIAQGKRYGHRACGTQTM